MSRDLHEQVRGVAFWRPANKVRSERQSGCECHGGTFSGGWERLRAASESLPREKIACQADTSPTADADAGSGNQHPPGVTNSGNEAKEPESLSGNLCAATKGGWELTADKIRSAIESAGIVFIDENGGGAGVRLCRNRSREKSRK